MLNQRAIKWNLELFCNKKSG